MSVDDAQMILVVPEEWVDPPAVRQPIGGGEEDKMRLPIRLKWIAEEH